MKLGYHSSKRGETLGFPLSKREWILYIELKESFSVQRGFNVYASAFKGPADLVKSKYIAKLVQVVQQGTDSRYLTEDMKPMLPALITQVAEKIGADASAWKADNGTELSVAGMCDSRKVSDHHAIMPSGRAWVRPLPRPGLTAPLPAPSLFFPCRCAIMGPNFRASGPGAHLVRNGAYNYDFSGIDAASVFAAQVQR